MTVSEIKSNFAELVITESVFGELLTELVNAGLKNGAPLPSVIFQIETVAFELRWKAVQQSISQQLMLARKSGKANSIVPAKEIPKIK